MDFFNKLTGGDDGKKRGGNAGRGAGGPQFKNPFANIGGRGPGGQNFRGGGQALGGTAPGKVISVSLPDSGPLGVKVEKRPNSKTAIVSAVLPNSQAEAADLQRGDIVCYPNTDGSEEIAYDDFLKMAASSQRPLVFDIRRISSVPGGGQGGAAAVASKPSTADAYAKRQAVIAAAEARDRAHKKKTKPIAKTGMSADKGRSLLSAAEKRRIEEQREELARQHEADGIGSNMMSEEARRAVAAAKAGEAAHAAELGYNPYETNKVSAGQAKTATVAMTHGSVDAGKLTGDGGVPSTIPTPGRVAAPSQPTTAAEDSDDMAPIDSNFDEAFAAVTMNNTDNSAVVQSLGTMRKLIVNATTKGQTGPDENSAKFRRVRLSNAKIKAAIADIHGALDLMLSVGFVLSENEDDGETYLVFPPGETGPPWLQKALKRMENYEKGSS